MYVSMRLINSGTTKLIGSKLCKHIPRNSGSIYSFVLQPL